MVVLEQGSARTRVLLKSFLVNGPEPRLPAIRSKAWPNARYDLVQRIVYFQSTAIPTESSIHASGRVKEALELNETVH